MPQSKRPVTDAILASAEALLRDHGDHGLSMRKLATEAGISLGHLQHYYKTKNDVLVALIDRYFSYCHTALSEHAATFQHTSPRERVQRLVAFGLTFVGGDLSDMCRLFREFWALATRNDAIDRCLNDYYAAHRQALLDMLTPVARSEASADRAVTFLIPWFEGFSVTHHGMKSDDADTELLVIDTTLALLEDRISVG